MSVWKLPAGLKRHPLPPVRKAPCKPRHGTKPPKATSGADILFLAALKARGLPQPHREYRFAEPRQFRADYAWPTLGVLCEVEGGIFTRQAHGSISGLLRDIEKYNLAATLGYRVVRCVPADLLTVGFLDALQAALEYRP